MKFLSEFRLCYRSAVTAAQEESDAGEPRSPAKFSRDGHAPSSRRHRFVRSRSEQWRPGLSAISETGAVSVAEKTAESTANRLSKKSATSKRKSAAVIERWRDDDRNYGRPRRNSSMAMSMPAFTPTPFMF